MSFNKQIVSVGEPLRNRSIVEGNRVDLYSDRIEIVLLFNNPFVSEIEAIQSGLLEFRLVVIDEILYLCLRGFVIDENATLLLPDQQKIQFTGLLGLDWQIIPFPLLQEIPKEFANFNSAENARLTCATILADYPSAIVKAIRLTKFPVQFSKTISQGILKSYSCHDADSYNHSVDQVLLLEDKEIVESYCEIHTSFIEPAPKDTGN